MKIRRGMRWACLRRAARSLRTDTNGSFVEMVAGGFRNPYDFAFNGDGEMFTYDADMEWDIGAPWYRPTRVLHVPPGGEYGWRSGWAKWPEYYLDSLPATVDIGPRLADGHRVLRPHGVSAAAAEHAVRRRLGAGTDPCGEARAQRRDVQSEGLDVPQRPAAERDGARCRAGRRAVLLDGRPRHRRRHLPRAVDRHAPPQNINFGQGIQQALDQPQFQSDWARARIAAIKRKLGDRWQTELETILTDKRNSAQRPAAGTRTADLLRPAAVAGAARRIVAATPIRRCGRAWRD